MNLKQLAANMTEVETDDYRVLFSYKTPVAYYSKEQDGYYVTKYKWSNTTTKHISKWLSGNDATLVEQSEIDYLLDKVK